MKRALLFVAAVLCARLLPGCGCTLVGCSSGVGVTITSESGMLAPGAYAVTVDGDGSEKCVIVLADNGGPSVEITESSCLATLDGPTLSVGSTILGDNITVTVTRDGMMLGTQSFEPEYSTYEPNGALCGPTCENAGVAISIP